MKKNVVSAIVFTLVTTVLFGLVYPLVVTGLAQVLFRDKANGSLIESNGVLAGSKLIGQPFSAPNYFHSRPSAAGNGYDAANSSGSNYGPTSKKLVDRVAGDVATSQQDRPGEEVPVDLVTASGSGLDPDITPAAAEFQVARVAKARHMSEQSVQGLVEQHITGRQLGLLGESRVNVLELNMALDRLK